MKKIINYVISILIPLSVGGIVGLIVSNFMDYTYLVKPFLSPPSALFPIVWTILYILLGISYGILKNNFVLDDKSKIIYYAQLLVNALWPIFFFVFEWRFFAFLWILLLLALIIIMIKDFYSKNKVAGLLQIPYLLWVIFASYLNLSIYLLNR